MWAQGGGRRRGECARGGKVAGGRPGDGQGAAAGGGTSGAPVWVVADPGDLTTCALEAGDVGAGFEGQVCPLQNRMQKTHCCAVPAAVADHPLVIACTHLLGAVVVWVARQAKANRTFYEGLAQWVALVDI